MIQRLADIRTDATAAFEKESKMLLVRWEDDLLTIALADRETGIWQAAERIKYDWEDALAKDFIQEIKQKTALVNYIGLRTQVFFATDQAMLIPKELAASANLFLQTQFGVNEMAEAFTDDMNPEMIAGFFVEKQKLALIQKLFPQADIRASLGLLVQQSLAQAMANQAVFYVQMGKGLAEVALSKEGRLLLARSFSFTANEDVLYHLLNACRVFEMAPQDVLLVLQGQVQKQDILYPLLETYFANLQFATATTAIQHPAFSQVPPHYFTPLIQAV